MPEISERQKFMMNADIADEIAALVGLDSFDPYREADGTADFTREETERIYTTITGESPEDLTVREMNNLIMSELGSELHAGYPWDFTRKDLKVIHQALIDQMEE